MILIKIKKTEIKIILDKILYESYKIIINNTKSDKKTVIFIIFIYSID